MTTAEVKPIEKTLKIYDDKYYVTHPKSYPSPTPTTWGRLFFVTMLSGIFFGAGLQRSQLFQADIIRKQFIQVGSFHMLQTFLFAEAFTLGVLTLISIEFPDKFALIRKGVFWDNVDKGIPNMRGRVSAFVGGFLLGVGGFVVAGSCPGTLFVQLGSGVHNSTYILAGALAGTALYGLTHTKFESWFNSWKTPVTKSFDQYLNVPYHYISIPFMFLVAGIAISIDFYTHQPEIRAKYRHLNPVYPGMLIGAAQLFSLFGISSALGCSSAYKNFISFFLKPVLPESALNSDYLIYFKSTNMFTQPKVLWQVGQVVFMMVGAYITSNMSGEFGQFTVGTSPQMAFIGGFVTLFGARLAGGCTSGHGLSGLAKLQNVSFYATAGMFLGGFSVEYFFLGILNPFTMF